MKKIIYFLSVFLLVFISCDPEEIKIDDENVLPGESVLPKEESLDTVIFKVVPKYYVFENFLEIELLRENYELVHLKGYFTFVSPIFTAPKYNEEYDELYEIFINGDIQEVTITGNDATSLIGTEVRLFFLTYGGCFYDNRVIGIKIDNMNSFIVKKGLNVIDFKLVITF